MDKPEVGIKFKAIELLKKFMLQRPDKGLDDEVFHFDIKADLKVNPVEKALLIVVDIDVREFNKETVIASISVGYVFEVENFETAIVKKEETVYNVPTDIDFLLKTVAVSTTRGIMFSEFKGTYLYKAILPLIFFTPPNPPVQDVFKKEE